MIGAYWGTGTLALTTLELALSAALAFVVGVPALIAAELYVGDLYYSRRGQYRDELELGERFR